MRSRDASALVVFESAAEVVSPLTSDGDAVEALLDSIQAGEVSNPGSDLSVALMAALRLVEAITAQRGDIVVISDGEDQSTRLDDTIAKLRAARRAGVDDPRRHRGAAARFRGRKAAAICVDDNGQVVTTYARPEALQKIAAATGGKFYANPFGEHALDSLAASGGTHEAAQRARPDRALPVAAGVRLRGHVPRIARESRCGMKSIAILLLVTLPFLDRFTRETNSHAATARGVKQFAREKVRRGAEVVRHRRPRSRPLPRAPSTSARRRSPPEIARQGSSTIAKALADPSLRADALFNRGNSALSANAFDYAIRDYTDALRIRPNDAGAKRNLEIALRRKQAMQKQQGGGSGSQQDRGPQPQQKPQPSPQRGRTAAAEERSECRGVAAVRAAAGAGRAVADAPAYSRAVACGVVSGKANVEC